MCCKAAALDSERLVQIVVGATAAATTTTTTTTTATATTMTTSTTTTTTAAAARYQREQKQQKEQQQQPTSVIAPIHRQMSWKTNCKASENRLQEDRDNIDSGRSRSHAEWLSR